MCVGGGGGCDLHVHGEGGCSVCVGGEVVI